LLFFALIILFLSLPFFLGSGCLLPLLQYAHIFGFRYVGFWWCLSILGAAFLSFFYLYFPYIWLHLFFSGFG